MTERNEISQHEVRVFQLLANNPNRWFTNRDISSEAKVAERTARMHTLRLVKLGLIDLAEVFPAHRYRWSAKAARRNAGYEQRLAKAAEVFSCP